MGNLAAVILAAGMGTRMKSKTPKVLHPVAGRPMVQYVIDAVRAAGVPRVVLVVGHQAERVSQTLGADVEYARQAEQLGTAHALLVARHQLEGGPETVLALYGDVPLISPHTLADLLAHHQESRAVLTLLSCRTGDPTGLGRVVRADGGRVLRVVEEKEASPEERRLAETNRGVYAFRADWLWPHLASLPRSPSGEFYLTDLVELAARQGQRVEAVVSPDPLETAGVNHRAQLAQVEAVVRARLREQAMLDGATLLDPSTTYIDYGVVIAPDTVIYPNTTLAGHTRVGSECIIGPNSVLVDAIVGDRCRVVASVLEEAVLEDDVSVGPFSHLRRGASLGRGVHVGNFAEVKQSRLGAGSRMGHFSYVGDAEVGREVNIGAGTVTCNFDGRQKHRTEIGDGAFIGSDTMLRAPVRVGARAVTGAGAVVTRDVPDGALAIGVPARVREAGSSGS